MPYSSKVPPTSDLFTPTPLRTFQRSLETPTKAEIEHWSPCSICWANYDEDNMSDQPTKLPCGHVYGTKCILDWAQGCTPSGRPNGCPHCRAQLLPAFAATSKKHPDPNDLYRIYVVIGGCRGLLGSLLYLSVAAFLANRFSDSYCSAVPKSLPLFWMYTLFLGYPSKKLSGSWLEATIPVIAGLIDCGGVALITWWFMDK